MHKRKILGLIILISIVSIGVWANIRSNVGQKLNKPLIVTTIYPLEYFINEVGGENFEVKNVTPVGVEPHDFEPTASSIAEITNADLFIYIGSGFESWAQKVADERESQSKPVLAASEGLIKDNDPHIWIDPVLASQIVMNIEKKLSSLDPVNATYYKANAQSLVTRLNALSSSYEKTLTNCKTRTFVTAHDAFGYLAQRYSLKMIPIAGISPDEEPSLREMANLVETVKSQKISTIFFETLANPDFADVIAKETGARVSVLDPIEGIEEGSGLDYISIQNKNLEALKHALSCNQ